MSNRTLIELNHDFWSEITSSQQLHGWLRHLLQQGAAGADKEVIEQLGSVSV